MLPGSDSITTGGPQGSSAAFAALPASCKPGSLSPLNTLHHTGQPGMWVHAAPREVSSETELRKEAGLLYEGVWLGPLL